MITEETVVPEGIIKKPLDQVISFVMRAVDKWRSDNNEKAINERVTKLLNTKSDEMTLKLLGFNFEWNEWKIDHCNGRSGNTAIGEYMRDSHSGAIKEFFDSLDLKMLITPTLKKKLIKDVQRGFEYQLEQAVREAMSKHTKQYVDKIVADIAKSDDLDHVIKTIELIGAN